MKQIPEKLINFTVYRDGTEYLGVSDVVLPNLEAMTETISGAGIAGEIDSPTLGHFASMTCTLNWRSVERSTIRLLRQQAHTLDFRGSVQTYDSGAGTPRPVGVKVTVKAIPKSGTLGNFQVATPMASSNELECTYIKIMIDGREMLEIDKFNFVCRIDGVDQLATVRAQLGL